MPNYRRVKVAGGQYFFTLVTYQRQGWLCDSVGRDALRSALLHVKERHPFTIDAIVLLPDHLHCIWTLPDGDSNYSMRWGLIKRYVTQYHGDQINSDATIGQSQWNRREGNLWQRRFWEKQIHNDVHYHHCCDYIHNNPVKHGLCSQPQDWPYSSIHRFQNT
jgi:putative transposase